MNHLQTILATKQKKATSYERTRQLNGHKLFVGGSYSYNFWFSYYQQVIYSSFFYKMSMYLQSIYLSMYLSIYLPIYTSIYLFIYLFNNIAIYLSKYLSIFCIGTHRSLMVWRGMKAASWMWLMLFCSKFLQNKKGLIVREDTR